MRIIKVRDAVAASFRELAVTENVREVVAEAVREDHPCLPSGQDSVNTCDIDHALESGYPLAAAWMLRGATETPALDAALSALRLNRVDVPSFRAEFEQWRASSDSDSIACPACGARVYREHERGCDNCGAELTIAIDTMIEAYVATALRTSLDDHGESLDGAYGADEIDPATLEEMRGDCAGFAEDNIVDLHGLDVEQVGEDFWLTRNRHGAGFWDRGLGERGDRLTRAAQVWGSVDLYIGDDGMIYSL